MPPVPKDRGIKLQETASLESTPADTWHKNNVFIDVIMTLLLHYVPAWSRYITTIQLITIIRCPYFIKHTIQYFSRLFPFEIFRYIFLQRGPRYTWSECQQQFVSCFSSKEQPAFPESRWKNTPGGWSSMSLSKRQPPQQHCCARMEFVGAWLTTSCSCTTPWWRGETTATDEEAIAIS